MVRSDLLPSGQTLTQFQHNPQREADTTPFCLPVAGSSQAPAGLSAVLIEDPSITPAEAPQVHRPKRKKPKRVQTERGLPSDDDLAKLARAYLARQRLLWPELVPASKTDADDGRRVAEMTGDFKRRHKGSGMALPASVLRRHRGEALKLAAAYLRYSCDNSNPRSLDDQLVNVLNKAHQCQMFVPWELLYADASVSGLDPSRQGYNSMKHDLTGLRQGMHAPVSRTQAEEGPDSASIDPSSALASPDVKAVLIDEFSRAGRDTLEWFRLSFFAKRQSLNVLGATDGFDLNSDTGQMMLHVFGMFVSFFCRQLREKVLRGMKGAARRGTSTGRPPLGYGLVPATDAQGKPVIGQDGRQVNKRVVHPETMTYVLEAAHWFADRTKSVGEIARYFREQKVDGSDAWRPCSIRRMLLDPLYCGIDVYGRTSNERDAETGARIVVLNPSTQWNVRHAPELRVFDQDLRRKLRLRSFKQYVRRKKAGCQKPGPKKGSKGRSANGPGSSRGGMDREESPTMLLDLVCQCGRRMGKMRSGKHAAAGCFDARDGLNGCTMTTFKALKIVEEAVLGWLRQNVLTEAAVDELLRRTNAERQKEASKPRQDEAPLKAEIARLTKELERTVDLLTRETEEQHNSRPKGADGGPPKGGEAGGEGDAADPGASVYLATLRRRAKEIGERISQNKRKLFELNRTNQGPPPPLSREELLKELDELREVLAQGGTASAVALRKITGPISVGHERHGSKKGGKWILSFTPTLGRLSAVSEGLGGPHRKRPHTEPDDGQAPAAAVPTVKLVVDKRPSVQELIAPQVVELKAQFNPETGMPYSIPEIATKIGRSVDVTYAAWQYAGKHGLRS